MMQVCYIQYLTFDPGRRELSTWVQVLFFPGRRSVMRIFDPICYTILSQGRKSVWRSFDQVDVAKLWRSFDPGRCCIWRNFDPASRYIYPKVYCFGSKICYKNLRPSIWYMYIIYNIGLSTLLVEGLMLTFRPGSSFVFPGRRYALSNFDHILDPVLRHLVIMYWVEAEKDFGRKVA
jgi:hypothetical protein